MTSLPTNYSEEGMLRDLEISKNPEAYLEVDGFKYSQYTTENDVHLYKSLSTVGDFYCKIWFRKEEFDEDRDIGVRNVILVGTNDDDPFIDDSLILSRYFNENGTVFVNAKFRRELTDLPYANRDLKDCVKFLSSCIGKYNGRKDEIKLVDRDNNEATYTMVYDEDDLSMTCSDSSAPLTLEQTYPNTIPDDAPIKDWGNSILGEPDQTFGSTSKTYNTVFGSGSISVSALKSAFGSNKNNIASYYRGGEIANISQNNGVPTSGQISFSSFRNSCNKIEANCSGNWNQMSTSSVFGGEWGAKINKTITLSGHAGSRSQGSPAVTISSGAQGNTIVFQITSGGRAYGWAGSPAGYNLSQGPVDGSGTLNSGGPGGVSMHVATPCQGAGALSSAEGGGGGGGKGGKGGQGGCGGHGGGRRCNGTFCWRRKRHCNNDGGAGGEGGQGGRGAWGLGYSWDPSAGWWVNISGTHLTGAGGGAAGAAGGTNAGQGGTGGTGGGGGSYSVSGSSGQQGQTGVGGGGDYDGCGFPCGRSGAAGQGGTSGGSGATKYTTSGNGYLY